ncbi:MAG: hypothetical protein EA407_02360 [Rhodobacteraceae bacterium]|nr:MAG: hypothetical protein EA407_02360 [Paracoccaceae bacterium]
MRLVLTLFLASLALPAIAEPQIRAVTLSTGGLAMIEAEGVLDAEGMQMQIRRTDIDDFLKSLRLADPGGGVPMLSMTGPGGVADVFAGLPFAPEALSDLQALLAAMIGAPVEAERRGTALSGAVMGTRPVPCATEGQSGCVALALRDEAGRIRQIALDEATELHFTDEADRSAMARGLDALRATSRALTLDVTLTSTETAPREVTLGWLQPAPLWKTAWRAEHGADGLVLTGWAVVENTTGQDWDAVDLTLATGAVQALQAQLYDRLEPIRAQAAAVFEPALAADAPRRGTQMFEAEMDIADVAMDEGESFSRFTLAAPVTLQAGDMISLPFLRETLEEARLTLYRGGSGAAHPMIALEINNPLPLRLPAGIMTLYETGRGHAGDAMIPELAPGAREMVEFARDTAMRIAEQASEAQRLQSARIVDGVLTAEDRIERRSTYRIEGAPEADRVLTLLHPLRHGWEMQTEGGEASFDATRFTIPVPAGEQVNHEVVETHTTATRIALLDLEAEALAAWSTRLPDPELVALLREMQNLREEERELRRLLARLSAAEAELIADQERLVSLIVQLRDDSPATRERRARVDAIEAEITAGRAERATTQTRLDAIARDLRALIRDAG